MNRERIDAARDRIALIRWYLLCDALIDGHARENDLEYLDSSVAKRTISPWMKERREDSAKVTKRIASKFEEKDRLRDDELNDISLHGFSAFVQSSPRGIHDAQRAVANILCDTSRLEDLIKALLIADPDWCRTRHDDELGDQFRLEFSKVAGAAFDDAIDTIMDRVSWLRKWSVDDPVEDRHHDEPGCQP